MIQAQSAFLIKGICLKPWFVDSIKNPISKRRSIKAKKIAANQASTASKVETELDKVVNSKKSYAMNYRVDGYDIEGKTVLPKWRMKRAADMLRVKIHTL